jgi:hypothetical protein
MYTALKFLALQGAPYIYDISRLRVKLFYVKILGSSQEKKMKNQLIFESKA